MSTSRPQPPWAPRRPQRRAWTAHGEEHRANVLQMQLDAVPDEAITRPWRVGEVDGVSRHESYGSLWARPHRGVRVWSLGDADAPRTRALAAAAALPGIPLAGWAAAHLLGVEELDGTGPDGRLLPVTFCPGRSGRIAPRPELVPWRSTVGLEDVVEADGVPVTSPQRTTFDLARTARTLHGAVADVDAVLRALSGTSPEHLADQCAAHPRWRGVGRARQAAALADRRSASRPESWLRVLWVQDAGLPQPLVNVPVRTGRDALVGRPDLLDPTSGLAAEYDGSYHRSAAQQHADAVRAQQMAAAGLVLVRASALDAASPRALVRRLLEGHRRALAVEHRSWWVPPAALRG